MTEQKREETEGEIRFQKLERTMKERKGERNKCKRSEEIQKKESKNERKYMKLKET
jgi:hypothetical protein